MTTAANITIKKNDGTTDIVYSLLTASGGDNSPAYWRSTTAPGTAGQQPWLWIKSRPNGTNTARRLDIQFGYPSVYTDSSSSLTQIRSKAIFDGSLVLPLDMTSVDMLECGAQLAHLINSALVVAQLQNGYAAT